MLREVTLENIFSFKKTTVVLRGLNVLIGPNAVGKSNLIEAISLLKAAQTDLNIAILRQGGVRVVCSLAGPVASPIAVIECSGIAGEPLQYRLEFSEQASGFVILREQLNDEGSDPDKSSSGTYFFRVPGKVYFASKLGASTVSPTESILIPIQKPRRFDTDYSRRAGI